MEHELERMIDAHGLAAVLDAIANVCAEKAQHVRASYSDNSTARWWDRAGSRVRRAGEGVTE